MTQEDPVVRLIGSNSFQWLSGEFNKGSTLQDIPDDILSAIASVDVTIRDYGRDKNAVTCIALITFAYRMAGRVQEARFGPKDMLLLKALARREKARRQGEVFLQHDLWKSAVFELVTGEVGERIRAIRTMNSPV